MPDGPPPASATPPPRRSRAPSTPPPAIEAATPLHRLASVADAVAAVAWLVSEQASYVTGKVIELDGDAEWPGFPNDSLDL